MQTRRIQEQVQVYPSRCRIKRLIRLDDAVQRIVCESNVTGACQIDFLGVNPGSIRDTPLAAVHMQVWVESYQIAV